MGGPEINEGSWILSEYRHEIDLLVIGEGEWFFENYFTRNLEQYRININSNKVVQQPYNKSVHIAKLVEPLTNRYLDPMPDGSSFIELVRGCPYKCVYCLYSKNCQGVREYPFNTLLNAIKMNSWMNLKELYVLAPTFNKMSQLSKKLGSLIDLKHSTRLHTEMRTGGIAQHDADLLYAAGFKSLEVGIQTLNKNAQRRINRISNTESELEGMKSLKNSGIELSIGMIAGLPGDTKEEFINSISRLCDLGFNENIELYYLMMLPGTKIREMAIAADASFLQKPPYYFLEGWGFSYEDILEIIDFTDSKRGYTNMVHFLPEFSNNDEGKLIGNVFVDLSKAEDLAQSKINKIIQSSVFTIHLLNGTESKVISSIQKMMTSIPRQHQLYNIIVYSNEIFREKRLIQSLEGKEEKSIIYRMNIYNGFQGDEDIKVFQVMDNPNAYTSASKTYGFVKPIFMVNSNNMATIEKVLKTIKKDEINVLIETGVYERIENFILRELYEFPERIAFKSDNEKRQFYNKINYPFVEWPSLFRSIEL